MKRMREIRTRKTPNTDTFRTVSKAYLEPFQTVIMELFHRNISQPLFVNYVYKKAPS